MFPFVCKSFVRGQAHEFEAYLHGITFNLWRPRFVVVHNTAPPDLAMYAKWQDPNRKGGPVSDAQWGKNLEGFYRDTQGWNGGPHLAVTPKGWVVLNPLNARGTHTPSWNYCSWGVETVGDFTTDKFDGDIRGSLVEALAVLHLGAGLSPLPYQIGVRGLHFHKEDKASSHQTCPGKNMVKADLINLVVMKMAELTPGDHAPVAPTPVTTPADDSEDDPVADKLAAKIVATMKRLNFPVMVGEDVYNIVYVEGMDPDGTPNANRPNAFDATRFLIQSLPDGTAYVYGAWDATTHAGAYYEHHKLNPDGAFHIALGQQTAWKMGIYTHGNYEALLQTEPLYGTRDHDEDFKRKGPTIHEVVGAHHHWGYDYPKDNVSNSAAGCQVGETKEGHREFIALLKTDRRYTNNPHCLWTSTVLTAEQVLAS